MKTAIVVFVLAIVVPVCVGYAQPTGRIQLYADEYALDCIIQDRAPGYVTVEVFYIGTTSIKAVQFSAPLPACWTGATYVGHSSPWLMLGGPQLSEPKGWSLSFGGCQEPPVYIGQILYDTQGMAETCCEYRVVKAPIDSHPEIPYPIVVDCTGLYGEVRGTNPGLAYVNGDHTCPCVFPVPVEETTWGQVKALYQ